MSSSCRRTEPTPCKDTKTCPTNFQDKKCKCITNVIDKNKRKNCDALQITCAYEEDGYLYACPVGCCQNQCDGECPTTKFSFNLSEYVSIETMSPVTKFIILLVIVFSSLILLSTIGLFYNKKA